VGIKDQFTSAAKKSAARVGKSVLSGFNRADEAGGELRDYVLAHSDSPTLKRFTQRLSRIRGGRKSVEEFNREVESAHERYMREAAAVAPPPTAADVEASKSNGLGSTSIAAQIYGRESCPWTGRAITVLNNSKIDYDFIDLDDPDNSIFEGRLVPETKQNTQPWIFLRGEFLGGFNALDEVSRLGQLEFQTMSPEQKASANPMLAKMSVAKRHNSDEVVSDGDTLSPPTD